jgi:hypothetical protein
MRPWARWTARMALVAVVAAAAGGGLPGLAFAGTGGGSPGSTTLLGGGGPLAPLSAPVDDVCGDASALLGIAVVGCRSGVAASFDKPRAAVGGVGHGRSASTSAGAAGAAGTAGADPYGTASGTGGARTGDRGASSASTGFQSAATSEPGSSGFRQIFGDTLNAPGLGAGTTNNPASSRSSGLGTLPGLADLPSLSGLTDSSAGRGAPGGSTLMPSSALSAADVAGMSSDSFAALAIGALLAGAAALKIASRRARDRMAGIGAAI